MVSPHGINLEMYGKADLLPEIWRTVGDRRRILPDNTVPTPEFVAEESTGRGEIVQGVMGQKNGRRRPGGPLLRPDDAVRKGHPHPVGAVFVFLVADPVEDDRRPFPFADRRQRQHQFRGLRGRHPGLIADAPHPPVRHDELLPGAVDPSAGVLPRYGAAENRVVPVHRIARFHHVEEVRDGSGSPRRVSSRRLPSPYGVFPRRSAMAIAHLRLM